MDDERPSIDVGGSIKDALGGILNGLNLDKLVDAASKLGSETGSLTEDQLERLEEAKEQLAERGEKVFNLGNLVGSFSINSGSSSRPLATKEQSDFNPVFKKGGKSVKPKNVVRKIIVDVFDGDPINVIAEMPGADKKDIEVLLAGKELTIVGGPKYKKVEVAVECTDKAEVGWEYNNGVLDIKIKEE